MKTLLVAFVILAVLGVVGCRTVKALSDGPQSIEWLDGQYQLIAISNGEDIIPYGSMITPTVSAITTEDDLHLLVLADGDYSIFFLFDPEQPSYINEHEEFISFWIEDQRVYFSLYDETQSLIFIKLLAIETKTTT